MASLMLCACAVTGVGVEGSVGYAGGYYEPYGYDYGGWGVGYRARVRRDAAIIATNIATIIAMYPTAERVGHAPAYRPAPAGRVGTVHSGAIQNTLIFGSGRWCSIGKTHNEMPGASFARLEPCARCTAGAPHSSGQHGRNHHRVL